MNLELLRARLHIDKLSVWKELSGLLGENVLENPVYQRDLTSEYYINLISGIVEKLQVKVPRYSKETQTDDDVCLEKETKENFTKNKDDNNKNERGDDKEGVFEPEEVKGEGKGECDRKVDKLSLTPETNLFKKIKNEGYEVCTEEYLESLGEVGRSRKKITLKELTDELYNSHIKNQTNKARSKRDKDKEEELHKLKRKLKELKEENENLKIRIGICQAELVRALYHEEPSQ